ncbi:MAG: Trk system potassium transporter TrkA [Pseudomonadota bacterium]
MKVIICGAGQVGANIARYLAAEGNDVTIVDSDPGIVRELGQTLDVKAIQGMASEPSVLERAGAPDTDMLIAVTHADEVNMVACQVAHSLFNVTTKIARVRAQDYLKPIWQDLFSRDHMPIDVIISPEIEVARAVSRRLQVPGAFNMIPLVNGRVRLIGVLCEDNCPIINTPLRQLTSLFPDLAIKIVTISRDDRFFLPTGDDQLLVGDQVYFVVDEGHISRAMATFGHEEPEARRILVIGGGNIGLVLAEEIEENYPGTSVRIIENGKDRARQIAQKLPGTTVINGDGLDPGILAEANVGQTETVVCVTNDDEANILGSLLAKRYGSQRAITLINKNTYGPLLTSLGIDAVVSPRAITASTILQHVRRGRIRSAHSICDGFAEIIDAEALETSNIVNTPIGDLDLPNGLIIGAIVRQDAVIIPTPETVIMPLDRVVILSVVAQIKQVEKMFSVRLEFF